MLAGTLTMPDKPIAAVVLISGSGPQNRDQLYMGHRPFLVLADYLTRHNIAVLRFDDRGTNQSQGNFSAATSYDFAEDASAAIDFLSFRPELKNLRLGVIGHSEGGLIAPIVANKNSLVDFSILLAAPSQSGRFVSENQMIQILLSNGVTPSTANAGATITASLNQTILNAVNLPKKVLKQKLIETYQANWLSLPLNAKKELKRLGGGSLPEGRLSRLTSDWYHTFLKHQPEQELKQITKPVLAIYAEHDVQISSQHHIDLMRESLSNSKHSKVINLADHNHLFQPTKSGKMSLYQTIEITLSNKLLTTLRDWIINLDSLPPTN